jgi:hypothetical protein
VSLKVKLNIVTGAFEMGGRARTGAESSAFHSPETLQVKPFPSRSSIYLLLKRLLTGKVNVKESAQQNPYTLLLAFFTPGEIVIEIIVKERLASPPRGAWREEPEYDGIAESCSILSAPLADSSSSARAFSGLANFPKPGSSCPDYRKLINTRVTWLGELTTKAD